MRNFIQKNSFLYKAFEKILNLYTFFLYKVSKKKGVLVYVGLYKGRGFDREFYKYKISFGFEANPELFKELQKKYSKYKNVFVYNFAVADYDGDIKFNISSNKGESSSIGNFNKEWNNNIKMEKTITVKSINLNNFLKRKKIDFIDHYISDIQGMDLTVLKTLKPLIDERKIGCITSEVTINSKKHIYSDLPDNSEEGFKKLLSKNYKLVSKGWGVLKNGEFKDVPNDWWEMDCRWCLKEDR